MKNQSSTGGWLLLLGIIAIVIGGLAWSSENSNARKQAESAQLGEFLFGQGVAEPKPNHAPAIVLFVGGGAVALFGMLLVAGASSGPGTESEEKPPPSPP